MNKKKQKNHATIIKSPPSQRRVNVFINIIFNSKKESKQGTSEIKKSIFRDFNIISRTT